MNRARADGPIGIVFDSAEGHTAKVAEALAQGAESVGAQVWRFALAEEAVALEALAPCVALVFGSPTFMGGVSARFKAFMDDSGAVWNDQPWRDRIAAGFTIGSNQSGDKLATLQHLAIFAAQHGMIWVGQDLIGPLPREGAPRDINGDGSWLGLMATSSRDKTKMVSEGDLDTARRFGQRIARAVQRWGQDDGMAHRV